MNSAISLCLLFFLFGFQAFAAPSAKMQRRHRDSVAMDLIQDAIKSLGDKDYEMSAEKALLAMERIGPERDALNVAVLALEQQKKYMKVIEMCSWAVEKTPELFVAHLHLGRGYKVVGKMKEAMQWLQSAIAHQHNIHPHDCLHCAYYELGHTYIELGAMHKALAAFRASVAKSDKFSEGLYEIAVRTSDFSEALDALQRALAITPDSPWVWAQLGIIHLMQQKDRRTHMKRAEEALLKALTIDAHVPLALYALVHLRLMTSNWHGFDILMAHLLTSIEYYLNYTQVPLWQLVWPLVVYYPLGDNTFQLILTFKSKVIEDSISEVARDQEISSATNFRRLLDGSQPLKLHVGYVGTEMHQPRQAQLLQHIGSRHSRVVPFYYSISELANTSVQADHRFIDVSALDYSSIAKQIKQNRVSILVDMNAHHLHSRPHIFALEPAFVSISLGGAAGSSYSRFIDYFASDAVASPPEYVHLYTEKLLLLPQSYVPCMHSVLHPQLSLPNTLPAATRKDAALLRAKDSFIFACFSPNLHIDEATWALWMQILHRTPLSVLWIVKTEAGQIAMSNLRAAAKAHSIAADRLIFTDSVAQERQLAIKSVADLMLDTPMFNSVEQIADALYAGVPVLTMLSTRPATRTGASILQGIGMGKVLIARTVKDYEDIAVQCATNKLLFTQIRNQLERNRRMPGLLFDINSWVSRWERALRMAAEAKDAGKYHIKLAEKYGFSLF